MAWLEIKQCIGNQPLNMIILLQVVFRSQLNQLE
jgi:hypothetical protein